MQCGASHSLALSRTGRVYSWGKNSQGQCGLGHIDECLIPTLNKTLVAEKVVVIAAGWEHSIALTDAGGYVYMYAFKCIPISIHK